MKNSAKWITVILMALMVALSQGLGQASASVLSALSPDEATVLSNEEAGQIRGTYQCTEYIYKLCDNAIFNKDKKGKSVWGRPAGSYAAYRDAKYWYADAKDKWRYGTSPNWVDPGYIMSMGTDINSLGHVAMLGDVKYIGNYTDPAKKKHTNVVYVSGIRQANLHGKGEVNNSESAVNSGYFDKDQRKFKFSGWSKWYGVNGFITNKR